MLGLRGIQAIFLMSESGVKPHSIWKYSSVLGTSQDLTNTINVVDFLGQRSPD